MLAGCFPIKALPVQSSPNGHLYKAGISGLMKIEAFSNA
jgi:hypothetical protein